MRWGGRSFGPTTLRRALTRMGFVQADPIRAPARAQDLILFQRVSGYRAGDLERRYESLEIEEDFFVNYGFVTRTVQALMHPRPDRRYRQRGFSDRPRRSEKERLLLEFVEERGAVHPREVEKAFRARQGAELLGWLVACDDANARRDALPRTAPGGTSRERDSGLSDASA